MILKVSKTSQLKGDVYISGSKNAALPIIAASLIAKKKIILNNIPRIDDVYKLSSIIKRLGAKVKERQNAWIIKAKFLKNKVFDEQVKELRGSYYLIGGLLSRKSHIKIKYPGGCALGGRPINYHLEALEKLGYKIRKYEKYLEIREIKKHPAKITFPKVSLGATINILMVASTILGITEITNPSLEPEVLDVIKMMNSMGAKITIQDNHLYVEGVKKFQNTTHTIIYDRMEAGSYLFLAGCIPGSKITIHNVNHQHLETVLLVAQNMGINITKQDQSIIVESPEKLNKIDLLIGEFPFFPTDLQQIISVALLRASGNSIIEDPIFPNRIDHLEELRKMGAYIYEYNKKIYIKESKLKPSKVKATDLRCSFALIMAASMASASTHLNDMELLYRGYEDPLNKLKKIGVIIEKV